MKNSAIRCFSSAASSLSPFQGLKPFQTDLSRLHPNPLMELQHASHQRGICNSEGYRLKGSPWVFSLAEVDARGSPTVRTIGFLRVSPDGLDWLTKRSNGQKKDDDTSPSPVAICYTHGVYPLASPLDSCEQWRAEGTPVEISVEQVASSIPPGSLAQMLALREMSVDEPRSSLTDPSELVQKARTQLEKETSLEQLAATVQVQRLLPHRMELLVAGKEGVWERMEWTRSIASQEWSPPQRIAPY